MNQILDHSGPKKPKIQKNSTDINKIIKVYAILIVAFAFCFLGKAAYSLTENKKIENSQLISEQSKNPQITLFADDDILSIDVSYKDAIEEVTYQWFRGNYTLEDIHTYIDMQGQENEQEQTDENDDEESMEDENEDIKALGEMISEKGTGQNSMTVQNIGIPKGNSTIYISVKTRGNATPTEYIQHYYTDVGVDKIKPEIKVILQGKKLVITATDETELSYVTYSINGAEEKRVDDLENDKKTIKTQIELDEEKDTEIQICAVDKARNSEIYNKTYSLYVDKPKIEFLGESDFSKIYVTVTYNKGIKRIEYELNGQTHEQEFENPEQEKKVEFEVPTVQGHNQITVKAYAEEEQVYAEATGDCYYNP